MTQPVQLAGIAWNHSRAFPPLVATAQRYQETHPGVRIRWEKRTLDEFGHTPIDRLATQFDLIIIDHPWAGFAFEKNLVRDLKPLFLPAELNQLAQNSVGAAFESYHYDGRLLALPIDAATPAPSWRSDLLAQAGVAVPETWGEAVTLARRKLAVIPGFNADLFLHFLMLLKALGAEPCTERETIVPREIMRRALEHLRELTEPMPREIFEWNPIQVAERMAATDDFAWNAFVAASRGDVCSACTPQSGQVGIASRPKSAARYGSRSVIVARVDRLDFTGALRSTATVAATGASSSIGGRSSRSRNCRA